jgi:hypothetical protein
MPCFGVAGAEQADEALPAVVGQSFGGDSEPSGSVEAIEPAAPTPGISCCTRRRHSYSAVLAARTTWTGQPPGRRRARSGRTPRGRTPTDPRSSGDTCSPLGRLPRGPSAELGSVPTSDDVEDLARRWRRRSDWTTTCVGTGRRDRRASRPTRRGDVTEAMTDRALSRSRCAANKDARRHGPP